MSLRRRAPFVHAPSASASYEYNPFKDSRPLMYRRRVGITFSMDIEESPIYVPSIKEVHEDVSPIKETNVFIPPIEETCFKAIRVDCPFISGSALKLTPIKMVMEITL